MNVTRKSNHFYTRKMCVKLDDEFNAVTSTSPEKLFVDFVVVVRCYGRTGQRLSDARVNFQLSKRVKKIFILRRFRPK